MIYTLPVTFSNTDTSKYRWVNLEQEEIPYGDTKLTYYDLNQMLYRVMSGESAYTYLFDSCKYVKILDGYVSIELKFYSWPSDIDLQYSVNPSFGSITSTKQVELLRSFDIVFDGTSVVDLDFIFSGVLEPQMPFFKRDGSEFIEPPEFSIINGTRIKSSSEVYTVLRATGLIHGFEHLLTMDLKKAGEVDVGSHPTIVTNISQAGLSYLYEVYPIVTTLGAQTSTWKLLFFNSSTFGVYLAGSLVTTGDINNNLVTSDFVLDKSGWKGPFEAGDYLQFSIIKQDLVNNQIRQGFNIDNLNNEIICYWVAEDEVAASTLRLTIPECVSALLGACGTGFEKSKWLLDLNKEGDEAEEALNVYYSVCSGNVLEERLEKR